MSGFRVDPSELYTFANGQLDRQADIQAAANSVSGISLGGDTFGQLLQFFADSAEQFAQETVDGINELAKAVGEAAEGTFATALTYERQEDATRQAFGGDR